MEPITAIPLSEDMVVTDVHISDIFPGDTVFHGGKLRTVCRSDLKSTQFMGRTLFGDSYRSGHRLVQKTTIVRVLAKP